MNCATTRLLNRETKEFVYHENRRQACAFLGTQGIMGHYQVLISIIGVLVRISRELRVLQIY